MRHNFDSTIVLFERVSDFSVIDKGIDLDNPLIFCANCGDGYVDVKEKPQDICWNNGYPGCEICGNFSIELIVYIDRTNSF